MLANQRGPQQHQRPLGQALLAAVNKDVDHIVLVSQSRPRDSSSGAHIATASLLAATPATDSKIGHLDPLGSPPPALTALRPAQSPGCRCKEDCCF
jgi:hypothetical protein